MCSTCFGHSYIHHQELGTILLNYHIGRIVLGSMCVGVSVWLACKTDTTPTQPHRISNTHRTKNNTTNVVIQQNSRKLLMMDIWMSESCWAHKWNKIASDIKLVFCSSTITTMHGPINIRCIFVFKRHFYSSLPSDSLYSCPVPNELHTEPSQPNRHVTTS